MPDNNDYNCFKNEIREELKDFKKDITDKLTEFKEHASKDIKDSVKNYDKSRKIEAWILGGLLLFILAGTINNTINNHDNENELSYTKRVLEKTIMTTQFANLQQSLINAEFRHDSEAMRQIAIEIENYKTKMAAVGFLIVETTRGIVIADEK